jgi:WD40 repeat protein
MRAPQLVGSLILLLAVAQGCDSPPGPTTGALRLLTNTTGGDLDLDGYIATVDNVPRGITANGTLIVTELATGSHDVSLSGIAPNCAATGSGATRSATVQAGDTTDVSFPVACVATGIRVTTATGGLDPDASGYTVLVDGHTVAFVGSNESRDITRLSAGSHTVGLTDLAANCSVAGDNPGSVNLSTGAVVAVSFNVSCVAATGVIEITVATTGVEFDPNGYRIQIDSLGQSLSIGVNGTVRFSGIALGQHTVNVMDRVSNCSVAGEHPRTVSLAGGGLVRDTARIAFAISCVATRGSIRITTATSGTDLDSDGYIVVVDEYCYYGCGAQWSAVVASNGEHLFTDIPVGEHWITVQEVGRNCSLAGSNPRSVNVEPAATAVVTLDVTCFKTGSVAVTVTTVGVDLDENGYSVSLSGPTPDNAHIASNGTVTFGILIPGNYQLQLSDVAINCIVTGPHPRPVTVAEGAPTSVALDVTCSQARQLALVSDRDGNPEIYLVKETGSGLTRLTDTSAADVDPAWSPDGSKIAFSSNRAGNYEIYVMQANGSNVIRLTNTAAHEVQPTWSPDGGKIAFSRNLNGAFDLYVMNADGSNEVPLTTDGAAAYDADPDWSPTGIIAFESSAGGRSEIWVMDADGGNRRQVTTTGNNHEPSWSPDGSKLTYRHDLGCGYYGCDSDLYIINGDGSGNVSINNSVNATSPDWSPDGQAIAFTLIYCSYYYYSYCDNAGIGMMHPDGLGLRTIIIATTYSPAWRPGN